MSPPLGALLPALPGDALHRGHATVLGVQPAAAHCVLVTVEGDGVLLYDARKQVRERHNARHPRRRRQPPPSAATSPIELC